MNTNALLGPVSVLVLLCGLTPAQDLSAIRDSYGASRTEWGAWAGGPDYSVRFDDVGPEFVPRQGGRGERSHGVRFRLESVRRGNEVVFTRTANVAPEVADNFVSYPHRHDLTERYEARRDGIEQTFVFAARPEGRGDLVVRGAIETTLPLVAATDDGIRYELPGAAGVTFGAVTGVDANGATARGSIRVDADGAHLEWVLPAAFVDGARYPLVLDPLLGSVITIGDAANGDDWHPNVAFDASTNRYLVVWNDTLSGTNAEMRGQFVGASGSPVGSAFFIGWGHLTRQALVNINGTDRFLVTSYTYYVSGITSSVRVRSISADTGAVSNPVNVEVCWAGSGVTVRGPVAGGDSRSLVTSDSALIAYQRNGSIQTCIVHVPSSGDPVVVPTSFTTIGTGVSPSVTSHGGNPLRWLVTWRDNPGSSPQHVRAGMVGQSAALCAPAVLLYIAIGSEEVFEPVCAAADGSNFFVAWQIRNSGVSNILGMRLTWSGACGGGTLSTGSLIAPVTTPGSRTDPVLAFAKDKYVLAWEQATTGWPARVIVKGLDPVTCASCGAEWTVENTVAHLHSPMIASRFSAGDTASDEALIVYSNNAVHARRFEARSNDAVATMGGGCVSGLDDFATYNGDAVLGNANFQLAIAGSVSLPLVLIVGFSAVSAPCGNCTIVPSPDILFPATNPHTLAIPCDPLLVGVNLYTQWLLLKPSTCPILPDFSFTNALKFTIGE